MIAWDLRAQAEHGSGAQSVLVGTDAGVLEAVAAELGEAEAVTLLAADSLGTAIAFVNAYAPEHLQLMLADAPAARPGPPRRRDLRGRDVSGTAYGDYVAGSNHILPTGGTRPLRVGAVAGRVPAHPGDRRDPPGRGGRAGGAAGRAGPGGGPEAHARSAETRAEPIADQDDPDDEEGAAT